MRTESEKIRCQNVGEGTHLCRLELTIIPRGWDTTNSAGRGVKMQHPKPQKLGTVLRGMSDTQ